MLPQKLVDCLRCVRSAPDLHRFERYRKDQKCITVKQVRQPEYVTGIQDALNSMRPTDVFYGATKEEVFQQAKISKDIREPKSPSWNLPIFFARV